MPTLISSLLCLNARFVGRMNRHGALKMARNLFSLQDCLSPAAVPMAELRAHLDRARELYGILDCDLEVRTEWGWQCVCECVQGGGALGCISSSQ